MIRALCGCAAAIAQTSITDATGRTITLPQRVQRVYVAGPPAAVLLLAVAPQKLIGWTRAPRPDEAAYLPDAIGRRRSLQAKLRSAALQREERRGDYPHAHHASFAPPWRCCRHSEDSLGAAIRRTSKLSWVQHPT